MGKIRCLLPAMLLAVFCAAGTRADVKMPAIFGNGMVLQRGMEVPVWGTAAPGEKITVTFAGQKATTETSAGGKWKVELAPMLSSIRPRTMTVRGNNTVTFDDVLVGEVWVCSGQSNMAYSASAGLLNGPKEIDAAKFPRIRMFKVKNTVAKEPLDNTSGKWVACSPDTMKDFSAVAYFFAREIHHRLELPVGLIGTYWGGTPAQAWTRQAALAGDPELKSYLARWADYETKYPEAKKKYDVQLAAWEKRAAEAKAAGRPAPLKPRLDDPDQSPNRPASLYNGMIAPLIPFAMRGVIWYQGESNASNTADALLYKYLFPKMIDDWRAQWGEGKFPFLFVQLANFKARYDQPTESDWALLRESQLNTLGMPATGMAVIVDAGEAANIHPKNKQVVGQRLALAALKVAYNKDVEWWGPLFDSMEKKDGKIVLHFKHTAGKLVSKSPEGVKGFAIAGTDKKFFWADAKIAGDTVVVSSPEVKEPVAARYAWADNPEAGLYNKEDLPATPFRTDAWEPGSTTAGVPAKPVVSEPVKKPKVLRPVRK